MTRSRNILSDIDWITVILYVVLVLMGYVSIYAADYRETAQLLDFKTPHGKQLIWITSSFILAGLVLIIDSKFFTTFAYIIYGLVLGLLVLVLVAGSTINGNKAWLMLGGFSLQPAEFAKFATCLALAKYMSALGTNVKNIASQLIMIAFMAVPVALILKQGDAGSAMVFSVFILVFYREGLVPGWVLVALFALGVLSVMALLIKEIYLIIGIIVIAIAVLALLRRNRQLIAIVAGATIFSSIFVFSVSTVVTHLKPHQINRINVLIGKDTDTKGIGYNVNQSKITIGSGGLTGKGFLNGTQTKGNFVPEQITDFIFCTVGEEHGFIGTSLVILLFLGLLVRILMIAERQRSKFSRIYGYGVACILFFHLTINIGMTIALVPVVGIPLPFFSYGGSSILAFTAMLFVLLKLDGERLAVLR